MKKYKYKLNMLEPGWKMIKAIGIFGVIGLVSYVIKAVLLCYIFSGLTVLIGIILWILLIVESHQDKVLNEQALQERRINGEEQN